MKQTFNTALMWRRKARPYNVSVLDTRGLHHDTERRRLFLNRSNPFPQTAGED